MTIISLDRFFTLEPLAERIADWANLTHGMRGLEPSCGDGVFIKAMLKRGVIVTAVELDRIIGHRTHKNFKTAEYPNFDQCYVEDFLKFTSPVQLGKPKNFDIVLMNPPYGSRGNKKKGIPDSVGLAHKHVAHALDFSDRVVALLPTSFIHGVNAETYIFSRAHLKRKVELIKRPKFNGPDDKGEGARRDYCVYEFINGKIEQPYNVITERW